MVVYGCGVCFSCKLLNHRCPVSAEALIVSDQAVFLDLILGGCRGVEGVVVSGRDWHGAQLALSPLQLSPTT